MIESEHMERAISIADKVVAMTEHALSGLELSTKHWPNEYRAIIWETVADIATKRAQAARLATGQTGGTRTMPPGFKK